MSWVFIKFSNWADGQNIANSKLRNVSLLDSATKVRYYLLRIVLRRIVWAKKNLSFGEGLINKMARSRTGPRILPKSGPTRVACKSNRVAQGTK